MQSSRRILTKCGSKSNFDFDFDIEIDFDVVIWVQFGILKHFKNSNTGKTATTTNGKKLNPTSKCSNLHQNSVAVLDSVLDSPQGSSQSTTHDVCGLAFEDVKNSRSIECFQPSFTANTMSNCTDRKMTANFCLYCCCSPNIEPFHSKPPGILVDSDYVASTESVYRYCCTW